MHRPPILFYCADYLLSLITAAANSAVTATNAIAVKEIAFFIL